MRIIYLNKTINDEEISKKEGEYFDLKHYKYIINKNCDGYKKDTNELLFKFRKYYYKFFFINCYNYCMSRI